MSDQADTNQQPGEPALNDLIRSLKAPYPESGQAALALRQYCERIGQPFAGFLRQRALPHTTYQRLAHLHARFGLLLQEILPAHARYNLEQIRVLDRYDPPYQAVLAALEAVNAGTGRITTSRLRGKLEEWVSEGLLRRRGRKAKLPGMPQIRRSLTNALNMLKKRGVHHPFVAQCGAFITESERPESRIGVISLEYPDILKP